MQNKCIEEEERRKTIKLAMKSQLAKHDLVMIELEFIRKSEGIKHGHEMERQRIKTAEIRKAQERKDVSEQARRWR